MGKNTDGHILCQIFQNFQKAMTLSQISIQISVLPNNWFLFNTSQTYPKFQEQMLNYL